MKRIEILVPEARGHVSVEVCPLLSLEKTRRHDHRAPFSWLIILRSLVVTPWMPDRADNASETRNTVAPVDRAPSDNRI